MTHLSKLAGCVLVGLVVTACASSSTYKSRDQLVSNALNCGEQRFEVYFETNQARLTPAALTAIQMTADQLRTCQVTRVQVVGLSDARGGVSTQNQTLSEQRAKTVADALLTVGLPSPAFEIAASGASGAQVDGVNDPLRRRTEVVIHSQIPR